MSNKSGAHCLSTYTRPMRWLKERGPESDYTGRVWLYSGTVVHTGWTFAIDTASAVRLVVKTHFKRENPPSNSFTLGRWYQSVMYNCFPGVILS